jgi:hypothetical protein
LIVVGDEAIKAMKGKTVAGDSNGRRELQITAWDVSVVDIVAGNEVLDVGVVSNIRDKDRVNLGC